MRRLGREAEEGRTVYSSQRKEDGEKEKARDIKRDKNNNNKKEYTSLDQENHRDD